MVTGPLSGHVQAVGIPLGLFPMAALCLRLYPGQAGAHPCLLARLSSLGRWPSHPALKWGSIIITFPHTPSSAFWPAGHSGVASGQPRHLEEPACSLPFCCKVCMTAVERGGLEHLTPPRVISPPLRGLYMDLSIPTSFSSFHRPSGGSLGAEGAS